MGPGNRQVAVLNQLLGWGQTLENQCWRVGLMPNLRLECVVPWENEEEGLTGADCVPEWKDLYSIKYLFLYLPNTPNTVCTQALCSVLFPLLSSWNSLYPSNSRLEYSRLYGTFLSCNSRALPRRFDIAYNVLPWYL